MRVRGEVVMRFPILLGSVLACAFLLPDAGLRAQACDPVGDVRFVCGLVNPEDLAPVPQSAGVVVASMSTPGQIYLVNSRDYSSTIIFPGATARQRHDAKTYNTCPGPLASFEQFRPHGLGLRPGKDGIHTLYVVAHGSREAVEVFELDARGNLPTLTWIGCAVAPETVGLNSVVALPDGGFAVTNFQRPGDPTGRTKLAAGETTGELWEWHPGKGWERVPGSETSGPNGLEVSKDGKWFYIGGWGSQSLIRLSRGEAPVKKDAVPVGFHIDNVHWAPDGWLFAAGHAGSAQAVLGDCLGQRKCAGVTSHVAKVHPETLKSQQIIRYPSNNLFILGTVAVQVGKEIWLGGVGGTDRIARFPAK
jgi:hypothetical protein